VSDAISQLGSSDFEASVLKSETPVLVDFWAEWCEPCKRMDPLLKELAGEMSGKLKVAKVNVEAHPAIANQFRVRGCPPSCCSRTARCRKAGRHLRDPEGADAHR
jgi:thioredoxin 1